MLMPSLARMGRLGRSRRQASGWRLPPPTRCQRWRQRPARQPRPEPAEPRAGRAPGCRPAPHAPRRPAGYRSPVHRVPLGNSPHGPPAQLRQLRQPRGRQRAATVPQHGAWLLQAAYTPPTNIPPAPRTSASERQGPSISHLATRPESATGNHRRSEIGSHSATCGRTADRRRRRRCCALSAWSIGSRRLAHRTG